MVSGTLLGQITATWLSQVLKIIQSNAGKYSLIISIVNMVSYVRVILFRDGSSGELKFTLEGHAMGVISVDVSVDGTRKYKR